MCTHPHPGSKAKETLSLFSMRLGFYTTDYVITSKLPSFFSIFCPCCTSLSFLYSPSVFDVMKILSIPPVRMRIPQKTPAPLELPRDIKTPNCYRKCVDAVSQWRGLSADVLANSVSPPELLGQAWVIMRPLTPVLASGILLSLIISATSGKDILQ